MHSVLNLVSDNPGDAEELCNYLREVTAAGTALTKVRRVRPLAARWYIGWMKPKDEGLVAGAAK